MHRGDARSPKEPHKKRTGCDLIIKCAEVPFCEIASVASAVIYLSLVKRANCIEHGTRGRSFSARKVCGGQKFQIGQPPHQRRIGLESRLKASFSAVFGFLQIILAAAGSENTTLHLAELMRHQLVRSVPNPHKTEVELDFRWQCRDSRQTESQQRNAQKPPIQGSSGIQYALFEGFYIR